MSRKILRPWLWFFAVAFAAAGLASCKTLPDPEVKEYSSPANVYVNEPGRPFQALGRVRTKVEWTSLNSTHDEDKLCLNYFNKALNDLYVRAHERGADAVISARSVTFQMDGKVESHRTAECSDDGQTGQVLAEGVAVKWRPVEIDLPPQKGRLRPRKRISGASAPLVQEDPADKKRLIKKRAKAKPLIVDQEASAAQDQLSDRPTVRRVKKHVEPKATEAGSGPNPGSPLFPSFEAGH